MTPGSCDELLDSLKRLYVNPEFADLHIASTYKTYSVHKAVITGTTIEVTDDDPRAVHLVIEYLYNLDYSDTLPEGILSAVCPEGHGSESPALGFTADSPVVIPSGFDYEAHAATVSEALGDSLSVGSAKKVKKVRKDKDKDKDKDRKEKKPRGSAEEPEAPHGTTPHPRVKSPEPPSVETPPESGKDEQPVQPVQPKIPPLGKLTTHAKLYSLSVKYGISELRTLALSKFQDEAAAWRDAADFVRAAREVYGSPLIGQDSYTDIRRVVTGVVYDHGELLDMAEMRRLLRGDLALDLIMLFREKRVW